tara:strand:+ start:678 stop:800 length:123 start_codon:yes stop_codon:yes gene_type:complete
VSIDDDDDVQNLLRVGFVIVGLAIFVAWAIYDGVGNFLDL